MNMYNEWQDSSDTSLVQWSIDLYTTKSKSGYLLQQYPSHVNWVQKYYHYHLQNIHYTACMTVSI